MYSDETKAVIILNYRYMYRREYREPLTELLTDSMIQECIDEVGVLESGELTDKEVLYEMRIKLGLPVEFPPKLKTKNKVGRPRKSS